MDIRSELEALKDDKYRDFQCALIPGLTAEHFLGVRTPELRKLAKKAIKSGDAEGFMASLSLALGLAEEIQACVGGIEIDSLFVDEGFGTLDMSSLGLVMKALGCGSETGSGRSVGIISHVADIEGQVNHKISVKNHRTKGSTVSIE